VHDTSGVLSKQRGAYYTPEAVACALVAWAAPNQADRLLDPACGDGIFIANHPHSVGVEQFPPAAATARHRAPGRLFMKPIFSPGLPRRMNGLTRRSAIRRSSDINCFQASRGEGRWRGAKPKGQIFLA
jgi:hypothetical protein